MDFPSSMRRRCHSSPLRRPPSVFPVLVRHNLDLSEVYWPSTCSWTSARPPPRCLRRGKPGCRSWRLRFPGFASTRATRTSSTAMSRCYPRSVGLHWKVCWERLCFWTRRQSPTGPWLSFPASCPSLPGSPVESQVVVRGEASDVTDLCLHRGFPPAVWTSSGRRAEASLQTFWCADGAQAVHRHPWGCRSGAPAVRSTWPLSQRKPRYRPCVCFQRVQWTTACSLGKPSLNSLFKAASGSSSACGPTRCMRTLLKPFPPSSSWRNRRSPRRTWLHRAGACPEKK
mmetsp:Transcript_38594/g.90669  ORF Transcript_38594/g.90669 Transcript_38594/m.90669 type:complete len:285 (-) Transcript_38594:310-1164(-)